MEVGPPGGRWEMKWNGDPPAAFWGRDCTSNCHFRPILPPATWAIPAGPTTASALLLGSDSSPQRQVRLTFVWPVLQSLPPSWQKAPASSQQLLPQPGAALWPVWAA